MAKASLKKWFDNCGGWSPRHSVKDLRAGLAAGRLDEQDEYGMTALHLAAASGWSDGLAELLAAGADTELRYFRTGETALSTAAHQKLTAIVELLAKAGANPDAPNYWGVTPRSWIPAAFRRIRVRPSAPPEPRIQNAEHLADHFHPRFRIPERSERETLKPGQAVNLCVYGPKSDAKQDTVKVRIISKAGRRPNVRYVARVETPIDATHLAPGTTDVEFGPEHVATVFVPRKTNVPAAAKSATRGRAKKSRGG